MGKCNLFKFRCAFLLKVNKSCSQCEEGAQRAEVLRVTGWGRAQPHVKTSVCPSGMGWGMGMDCAVLCRETGNRHTELFSGQTNDLEKPNESKHKRNGKMEKYASKGRMLHNNWTTTWQTETIAMTEQMFSSCPEASSHRKCSSLSGWLSTTAIFVAYSVSSLIAGTINLVWLRIQWAYLWPISSRGPAGATALIYFTF